MMLRKVENKNFRQIRHDECYNNRNQEENVNQNQMGAAFCGALFAGHRIRLILSSLSLQSSSYHNRRFPEYFCTLSFSRNKFFCASGF